MNPNSLKTHARTYRTLKIQSENDATASFDDGSEPNDDPEPSDDPEGADADGAKKLASTGDDTSWATFAALSALALLAAALATFARIRRQS